MKYLGGEIQFAVDHWGIDMIVEASKGTDSAGNVGTWSSAISGNGDSWIWKKYEFIDQLEKGSNLIFGATLRGVANTMVCGNNVARVIKQLGDFYKPVSTPSVPTGPIKIGTVNGITVIQDPFLSTNHYTLGYRGDNYLHAGFIYAPYIPLFSTPTLMTADLFAQKGFLSAAGFKVINPGLFAYGTISGLS